MSKLGTLSMERPTYVLDWLLLLRTSLALPNAVAVKRDTLKRGVHLLSHDSPSHQDFLHGIG